MYQIIDNHRGKRTIRIQGDMDAYGVLESGLNNVLERLCGAWDGEVELDFTEVPFMDSSGIGAIVYLYKRLTAEGRTMEIVGAAGQPRELLKTLRIDRSITVKDALPVPQDMVERQAIAPGV